MRDVVDVGVVVVLGNEGWWAGLLGVVVVLVAVTQESLIERRLGESC